jgi:hypothetical protein
VNVLVAPISIALGIAYLALGVLCVTEMLHEHKTLGVSRFGVGYILMASSCGTHHLIHGHHALLGDDVSVAVAIASLVALPCGGVFVTLRIEAFLGGRGDRHIDGTPWWLLVLPVTFLIASGVIIDEGFAGDGPHVDLTSAVALSNLFVVVTYALVGWPLLRTQLRRHGEIGGWSLSGLTLAGIFPTCALTHLAYALTARGDLHTTITGIWGIPASIFFLWVVHALHRDSIVDWNRRPFTGERREPERPSQWSAAHQRR